MTKNRIYKKRIDSYLMENSFCDTRNKAQELIKNGQVKIDGKIIHNKSVLISDVNIINVISEPKISRGYFKIKKAQEEFLINFENKIILDIGSSTGGFCEFMLEKNPKKIFALDVGSNQLNSKIKKNKKIISMENTNFTKTTIDYFNEKINLITCDVSFISIKKILNHIEKIKLNDFEIIFLLKPQFEIGKELIKKNKGFVNQKYHSKIIKDVFIFLSKNYNNIKITQSPITGAKKRNIEYLIYAKHN